MATNLITAAQAQALLPRLSASEVAALPSFLGPASRAVEKWCRQALGYGSWLEYHRPGLTRTIRLKNGFVLPGSVEIRTEFAQVAAVACSDPNAMRATVTLSGASLTLASYSTSAPSPTVLTLASYATVGQLVAAIDATSGWSATANPGHTNWLVTDLEPNPGAMGALGSHAMLYAFVHDLSEWALESDSLGVIELTEPRPQAFRYPDRAFGGFGYGLGLGLFGGQNPRIADVRCAYQAGFDPSGELAPVTPDDLAEGVALTIRAMLDSGQFSGVLKSIELGNTKVEINGPVAIPDSAKGFVSTYVKRSLG